MRSGFEIGWNGFALVNPSEETSRRIIVVAGIRGRRAGAPRATIPTRVGEQMVDKIIRRLSIITRRCGTS
jgi:hypothetical protein